MAAVVDVDVGPAGEALGDLRVGLGIRVLEHGQRLVREHDAEPERVARRIALVQGELPVGSDLAHQDREIEPAGASADDRDPHC
jgi:hypothetical protein